MGEFLQRSVGGGQRQRGQRRAKLTVTLLLSEIADQGGQVQSTQASVSLRMHLAPSGWLVDGPEPVVLHTADEMATLGQPFYNGC